MSKNKISDIELLEDVVKPVIAITPEVYMDMQYIIEEGGKEEISWLGSIKQVNNKYLIDSIFIFLQECSYSSIEIMSDNILKFVSEKLKKGNSFEKDCMTRLRFWGHTHPGGSTSPSRMDETQMNVFKENPFFIRGIFTKNSMCSFSFFDYKKGLKFNFSESNLMNFLDVKEDTLRRDKIKKEIKEKVLKQVNILLPGKYLKSLEEKEFGNLSDSYLEQNFYNY